MEAHLVHGKGCHFSRCLNNKRSEKSVIDDKKKRIPPVLCVLAKPSTDGEMAVGRRTCNSAIAEETNGRIVYKDNFLERFAINHLSHSLQSTTGYRVKKEGYKGLVEAAKTMSVNFSSAQQHELVLEAINKAIPKFITIMIKTMLPNNKFSRELFSTITVVSFAWLIGHCEIRESDINGRKEKNVVHINKCRQFYADGLSRRYRSYFYDSNLYILFLEESNCVGLCTNLCKMPSQTFIKDSFGMSVNMVPNFDDMSCQMIFGQEPPSRMDDPAFKQPCYALCKTKQKHRITCPTSNRSN